MALTATSKSQLNALLGLLTIKHPALNLVLIQAARNGHGGTPLTEIITSDGYGSADAHTAGQAAVATLLADIAAN
jgi:hypothetical protein